MFIVCCFLGNVEWTARQNHPVCMAIDIRVKTLTKSIKLLLQFIYVSGIIAIYNILYIMKESI